MKTVYDFTVKDRQGNDVSLSEYQGKVLLIVNTATGCGFTPHYEPLEAMYKELKDQGFEILDFPCNQFANQAPGSDDEIHQFCTLKFGTEFPQFAKIDVNGENADPLYAFLAYNVPDVLHSEIQQAQAGCIPERDRKYNPAFCGNPPTDDPVRRRGCPGRNTPAS